jgi:hypothetical protein
LQPIGAFSRSLKLAIDFLARVTTGFCPAMASRSAVAKSITLAFSLPSPTPMLITTFISRGTWKGFVYSRSFMSAGITAVRKRSRIRGGTSPLTLARLTTAGSAGAACAPRARPPPPGALPPCAGFGPFGAFGDLSAFLSSAIAVTPCR